MQERIDVSHEKMQRMVRNKVFHTVHVKAIALG
jgi:hypothetical protein